MTDALELGIGRDQFWRFTIRELFQEIAAAVVRRQVKLDDQARQMWLGLDMYARAMSKKGRRPKLQDYLVRKPVEPTPQQRHDHMLSMLHTLAAKYGGTVRTVNVNGG